MRAPAPHTAALMDQVHAVLRDSGSLPMTTRDLSDTLGTRRQTIRCTRCHGTGVEEREWYWMPHEVLRLLYLLHKRGLVERIELDGQRSLYWRAISVGAGEAEAS